MPAAIELAGMIDRRHSWGIAFDWIGHRARDADFR
jgi:hypothetical protein